MGSDSGDPREPVEATVNLAIPVWAGTSAGSALIEALDAGRDETRLVGGAVRDALLGIAGADIDLATRFTPVEVMRRVVAAGSKAVPTGIAHGTITAVAHGFTAEVTTLRRDLATDGRHAEVAFTDDWEEDASRRDFTINALYASLVTGEISDFFGGLTDLDDRNVRFIGEPLQRIAEDHLRILRFFRFSARFAKTIDPAGLEACAARANDLMALSRERIAGEMRGLLSVADPAPIVALMLRHGILKPVIPEITEDRLPALSRTIAAEVATGVSADWRRRLAALLPADAGVGETVGRRLRLSNADRIRIAAAVVPLAQQSVPALAWSIGAQAVADRLLIAGDVSDSARDILAWQRPKMPVSGRDLLARGLAPGPQIAKRLLDFERAWIAAGFPLDDASVETILGAVL